MERNITRIQDNNNKLIKVISWNNFYLTPKVYFFLRIQRINVWRIYNYPKVVPEVEFLNPPHSLNIQKCSKGVDFRNFKG